MKINFEIRFYQIIDLIIFLTIFLIGTVCMAYDSSSQNLIVPIMPANQLPVVQPGDDGKLGARSEVEGPPLGSISGNTTDENCQWCCEEGKMMVLRKSGQLPQLTQEQIADIVSKCQQAGCIESYNRALTTGTCGTIQNDEQTTVTPKLYWGFDKDLDGWEITGTFPPWHTMNTAVQWCNQWGGSQGVIVIDACESTPAKYQAVHAQGGIWKDVTIPQDANRVTFNVVRENHDGGVRFSILDSDLYGSQHEWHTLGEEILSGAVRKQFSYDISAWRGKKSGLRVQAFGAGTDVSGCVGSKYGCGSCCYEYVGIDSVTITSNTQDPQVGCHKDPISGQVICYDDASVFSKNVPAPLISNDEVSNQPPVGQMGPVPLINPGHTMP